MATFIVSWMESKETKVGPKYNATLSTPEGGKIENVTLWPRDWPSVMNGQTVEGDLVAAKDPKFGPSLYPAKTWAKKSYGRSGIAKAQERKAEYVHVAQENKELGIKVSSTMGLASKAALAEFENSRGFSYGDTLQENIKGWRTWYWNEWDKTDKDYPPF